MRRLSRQAKEEISHYRRDRIIVLSLVLLILGPFVLYALGAARAAREIARRDALEGNLATAQLGAQLIDAQCRTALAVLHSLVERRTLVTALQQYQSQEPGRGPGVNGPINPPAIVRHLQDAVELVPDFVLVAAYLPDGKLAANYRYPDLPAPVQSAVGEEWFQECQRRKGPYISGVYRLRGAGGPLVVGLAVPIRVNSTLIGYLSAPLRLDILYTWLRPLRIGTGSVFYIVDRKGRIVASSGEPTIHRMPPGGYPPAQLALAGQQGKTTAKHSPVLQTSALVGYAPARKPQWAVVVAQSEQAALAPANQVLRRFLLLMVPLLAIFIGAGWAMDRLYVRQARLARENLNLSRSLALQNESLRAADQAKSDFLANVSHNLRTPLASIKASVSGLLEPDITWDHESLRGFLVLVHEEIDRLAAEVRNLLAMARIEARALSLEKVACDLAEIIDSAIERVEPLTRGWSIEVELPPEPLLVEADSAQIETVIMNLLENAVKYSPPHTTLHLRAETSVSTREGAAFIMFALRDPGPGVSPGDEEAVFEKFFRGRTRTDTRGTGLGLAICRGIIEAHGGAIGVRRAPGGGAEFWFSLPWPEHRQRLTDPEGGDDESGAHPGSGR
jgi:signal transduction histidine kinase